MPETRMRAMRPEEYEAYTREREQDTADSLAGMLAPDEAAAEARRGTLRFLPDGLATPGHQLLVAESAEGSVVGWAWLGLTDPRTGSAETAYLYDIRVRPEHRRRGYAKAMLDAIEAIARRAGAQRLALNVFGGNHGAIALYTARGYAVTMQQMAKELGEAQR